MLQNRTVRANNAREMLVGNQKKLTDTF